MYYTMQDKKESTNQLLLRQCQEINNYISQFPPEEKDQRILEWIEKYAVAYRQNMEALLVETDEPISLSNEFREEKENKVPE